MADRIPEFTDKFITCCDCGDEFLFEVGEQAFFYSKGLADPKRCPSCRKARKQSLLVSRISLGKGGGYDS